MLRSPPKQARERQRPQKPPLVRRPPLKQPQPMLPPKKQLPVTNDLALTALTTTSQCRAVAQPRQSGLILFS